MRSALLLAVLVVTAGRSQIFGPDKPPSDQRALDAVAESRAALTSVDSYSFTVDARVTARNDGEQRTVDVDVAGAVDVAGRRMVATSHEDGEQRRAFVSDGTAVRECARVGWERRNLSRDVPWVRHTPAGRQLALLNRTDVYWRGTRQVDGREVLVVVGYPTKEAFLSDADAVGTDLTDLGGASVRNITVELWLDPDTHLPVGSEADIELERQGATATVSMTTVYGDYGEPVDVTLPDVDMDEEAVWEGDCPS